jgi:hypothetical protein
VILLFFLVLLAAQAPPPTAASSATDMAAGRICGLDARDNEKLLAQLRAKPEFKPLQDDGKFVQLIDTEHDIVWAFTVKGGKGYPAVSCNELGPVQGHLVFRQSMVCNGAADSECKAFYLINRQRNARMAAELEARLHVRQ